MNGWWYRRYRWIHRESERHSHLHRRKQEELLLMVDSADAPESKSQCDKTVVTVAKLRTSPDSNPLFGCPLCDKQVRFLDGVMFAPRRRASPLWRGAWAAAHAPRSSSDKSTQGKKPPQPQPPPPRQQCDHWLCVDCARAYVLRKVVGCCPAATAAASASCASPALPRAAAAAAAAAAAPQSQMRCPIRGCGYWLREHDVRLVFNTGPPGVYGRGYHHYRQLLLRHAAAPPLP